MELGYTRRLSKENVYVYEHKDSDSTLLLRPRADSELILPRELAAHQFQLVHMGIIAEEELVSKVEQLTLQETP
ncbi:MAG: hypothetical protein AAFQ98_04775 [Bacteroidota bacterium]